jgi:hypothetical protein
MRTSVQFSKTLGRILNTSDFYALASALTVIILCPLPSDLPLLLIIEVSSDFRSRKIHITEAIEAILREKRVQNRTQAAIRAMNDGSSICAKENGSYHLAGIPDRAIS